MSDKEIMQIVEALLQNESFKAAFVGLGVCSAMFGGIFIGLMEVIVDLVFPKKK